MPLFPPQETLEVCGPMAVEEALSNVPLFGKDAPDPLDVATKALDLCFADPTGTVEDRAAPHVPLPPDFFKASTVGQKLQALRDYVKGVQNKTIVERIAGAAENSEETPAVDVEKLQLQQESKLPSWWDFHYDTRCMLQTARLPAAGQAVRDRVMLLRAREGYLFNPKVNRRIVSDDCWIKYMWDWIGGEFILVAGFSGTDSP